MNLNSDQMSAIGADVAAAINVVAGAGTGKTTVLVERYLKLVREDGVAPDRLLALTFTLKAAAEMRERVKIEVARTMPERTAEFHDAWIMNFHQFGLRVIKGNAPAFGIDPDVGVLSPADFHRVRGVLRRRFIEGRIDGVPHDFGGEPPTPAKLESRFEVFFRASLDCRSALFDLGRLRDYLGDDEHPAYVACIDAIVAVGRAYEDELGQRNLIDFGDMIALPAQALATHASLRETYVKRFDHILVDEFQDTSESQNALLQTLCGGEFERVTVVGDAKQSIYRWRDARVENILTFHGTRYPLKANYRSRQNILDIANGLIEKDPEFKASTGDVQLQAHRGAGDRPIVLFHPQEGYSREQEAAALASWVCSLTGGATAEGFPDPPEPRLGYGDVTILLRKLKHSGGLPEIESEFERRGIPYAVIGGANAAETWALEGLHAMLSLLVPGDRIRELLSVLEREPFLVPDEVLYEVFVNVKRRPIGHDWLADEEIARAGDERSRERMTLLRELLAEMRERMLATDFRRFVSWAVTESSLLRRLYRAGMAWRAVDDIVAEVYEILDTIEQRGEMHLPALLENLRAAIDEKKFREEGDVRLPEGRVRIMTVHQAKGLEFPAVAVAGIAPPWSGDDRYFISKEKGLFFKWTDKKHWNRSFDDIGPEKDNEDEMEKREERCVLYVALTRAKDYLWVSSPYADGSKKGTKKDQESLFCDVLATVREGGVDAIEIRDVDATGTSAAPAGESAAALVSSDDVRAALAERNEVAARLEASRSIRTSDTIEFVNWSALDSFATCPLQYAYRYRGSFAEGVSGPGKVAPAVDEKGERFGGVEIPEGIQPAEYGILVHEALKETMAHVDDESGDASRIVNLVNRRGWRSGEAAAVVDATARLVKALRASELGTAGDGMRLEEPFELRLDRLVFHGIFDRVEKAGSGWRVTDYKVGLEDPLYLRQIAGYQWALERITGESCTGQICYLRGDGAHIERVTASVADVEATALAFDRALADGRFGAQPGECCTRCTYRTLCPSAPREQLLQE